MGILFPSREIGARLDAEMPMSEILSRMDGGEFIGLVAVLGGLACGAVAILAGTWQKVRRAELNAALKQDMLNRGMSAEDIRTVCDAGSRRCRRV
jgi:hypothetical protein